MKPALHVATNTLSKDTTLALPSARHYHPHVDQTPKAVTFSKALYDRCAYFIPEEGEFSSYYNSTIYYLKGKYNNHGDGSVTY